MLLFGERRRTARRRSRVKRARRGDLPGALRARGHAGSDQMLFGGHWLRRHWRHRRRGRCGLGGCCAIAWRNGCRRLGGRMHRAPSPQPVRAVVLRRRLPEFLGQRFRRSGHRPRLRLRRGGCLKRLRCLRLNRLQPFLHRLIVREIRQIVLAQKLLIRQQQIVAKKLFEQRVAIDAVVHRRQVRIARLPNGRHRRCGRRRHHSRANPHRSTRWHDPRIRVPRTDSLRPFTIRASRIPMRPCHNPIGRAGTGFKRPSRKFDPDLLRRSFRQLRRRLRARKTANGNPVVGAGKLGAKKKRKSGQSTHSAP